MRNMRMEGYLSENNQEYRKDMEKKKKAREPKAYGEQELQTYKEYQKMLTEGKTEIYGKPLEQEFAKVFEWLRKYAARDFDSVYHGKQYQELFNQALENNQIHSELSPLICIDGKLDTTKTKTFLNDFKDNNDLWAKVLELHIIMFKERAEVVKEQAERSRKKFLEKAMLAIKAGTLRINEGLLIERVKETAIYVHDYVENSSLAEYGDHAVTLLDTFKESETEHVVFHELVHSLSGRIIAKKTMDGFSLPNIEHVKIGLTTKYYDGIFKKTKRSWLNEAITERKALMLLGDNSLANYGIERAGLETLLERGLSEDVLDDAYFENFDPDTKTGLPAWKNLMVAIQKNAAAKDQLAWLDKTMEE